MLIAMLHPCRRARGSGDGGFAVVMALLVTSIAFVIMAGILAQAIHNVSLAGLGRRRVMAVNAAEAGLNWYASQLNSRGPIDLGSSGLGWTPPSSSSCKTAGVNASCWYRFASTNPAALVASSPEAATFEIRVLYLSANPCLTSSGSPRQCTLDATPNGALLLEDSPTTPFPDTAYAVVRSTGVVGTANPMKRTLESYIRIRAIRGNSDGLSATSLCLGSAAKVTIEGDLSVDNQALSGGTRPWSFNSNCPQTYTNGTLYFGPGTSLSLQPGAGSRGSLKIKGGGVKVDNTIPFVVRGDVQAEGPVEIGTGSPLAACPTSGTIQCIYGDAMGSAVTIGSNAAVLGDPVVCSPACPPDVVFSERKWNIGDWTSTGWTVQDNITSTTSPNLLGLMDAATVPTVFHITSTTSPACDLTFAKSVQGTIYLEVNVAVVSECRFSFGTSSTKVAGPGTLLLINAVPSGGLASVDCKTAQSFGSTYLSAPYGPRDVMIEQNPDITSGLFIYTPCTLWIGNNQAIGNTDTVVGQFAARYLVVNNQVVLRQQDFSGMVSSIPGRITSFYQDVKFVREISVAIAEGNQSL